MPSSRQLGEGARKQPNSCRNEQYKPLEQGSCRLGVRATKHTAPQNMTERELQVVARRAGMGPGSRVPHQVRQGP